METCLSKIPSQGGLEIKSNDKNLTHDILRARLFHLKIRCVFGEETNDHLFFDIICYQGYGISFLQIMEVTTHPANLSIERVVMLKATNLSRSCIVDKKVLIHVLE